MAKKKKMAAEINPINKGTTLASGYQQQSLYKTTKYKNAKGKL